MQLYGICVDNLHVKWNKVLEMLKEFDSSLYQDFTDNIHPDESGNYSDESIDDCFRHYDSDGFWGLGAFLHDFIMKEEKIDLSIDESEAYYLGVSARAPWEFPESVRNLTEKQLYEILYKYVGRITDDDLQIQWWFVDDDLNW